MFFGYGNEVEPVQFSVDLERATHQYYDAQELMVYYFNNFHYMV